MLVAAQQRGLGFLQSQYDAAVEKILFAAFGSGDRLLLAERHCLVGGRFESECAQLLQYGFNAMLRQQQIGGAIATAIGVADYLDYQVWKRLALLSKAQQGVAVVRFEVGPRRCVQVAVR